MIYSRIPCTAMDCLAIRFRFWLARVFIPTCENLLKRHTHTHTIPVHLSLQLTTHLRRAMKHSWCRKMYSSYLENCPDLLTVKWIFLQQSNQFTTVYFQLGTCWYLALRYGAVEATSRALS